MELGSAHIFNKACHITKIRCRIRIGNIMIAGNDQHRNAVFFQFREGFGKIIHRNELAVVCEIPCHQ